MAPMVMSRRARLAAVVGVLLIAVSLSGCATAQPAPTARAEKTHRAVTPKATPSATPSPTPTPALFAGATNVITTDGYTFSVAYNFALGTPFTKSVTKESPGYSAIFGSPSARLTVRNTTPGRILTFTQQGFGTSPGNNFAGMFQIAGIFPDDSPVCALVAAGYSPAPPTASALGWTPASGCAYVYLNAPVGPDGSNTATLNPGETKKLSAFGSIGNIQTYGTQAASNLRTSTGPMIVAHVPDAQYDAIFAALSAPPKIVLESSVPLTCHVIATSDGSVGC